MVHQNSPVYLQALAVNVVKAPVVLEQGIAENRFHFWAMLWLFLFRLLEEMGVVVVIGGNLCGRLHPKS